MADEKLPNSDGFKPGVPDARPIPSFTQDVIYAGAQPAPRPDPAAPRADAALPAPMNAAAPRSDAIAQDTPPAALAPSAQPEQTPRSSKPEETQRSELDLFFSWFAGVTLILVCGWGFIAFCCYLDRWFHLHLPIQLSIGVGSLGSLGLLYLLETNLWLSRFMGLRLGPHSTQITETLFFFFTGIVGLLLRTSDKPSPAMARPHENDGTREIIETVVFVVVLVLLLKTFLVEAFVIPTGSMADTLLGYHKDYTCEKCQYHFVVNCSTEAEPKLGERPNPVIGGFCPNCGYEKR